MADDTFFGFSTHIPTYEDEDLAAVDPSLVGLRDGDDDIDLHNEDTFGSGAVDDDWEEAHRKLAGLDIQSDPPQLTPGGGITIDDTNLDKEEEILEKNLARLVDEDDAEPNSPYASTGYKDIPSPSVSAVWNGSPLSSPTSSDSFHDLINPSTNIWASPTQPPGKESDIQGSSNKITPGIKPYRRPFSPAFEDDAILTAVPKQETLLPPSSFTKKVPTNAIRLEDLEKELSQNKDVKNFTQTPLPAKPSLMGQPPPGLPSPRMMPQTPQRYPHMQPRPSPMYHGQNSPRPGLQPFPRTPHMMPNRHAYNKMPFPAGTPPYLQRVPMMPMHSDPGHLLRRGGYHNMPPPRPRFSTPQGYHSSHYQPRMNHPTDNRYTNQHHRDNQHHQGTPYQPTDLERKIHSILNNETVNNHDRHAGLMTRREKEWIIKIQLLQLTSSNPDMDDFYFQTYMRRKRAKDRAKQGDGVEIPTSKPQPTKMNLPEFERQEREYKPMAFKDTLGKVSASHIAHPREMVQIPHIHKDLDQDKPGSVAKETRHRRHTLFLVEKAFDLLLDLEDIANRQLQADPEERNSLLEKKRASLTRLTSLLKLSSEDDTASRSEMLGQLMSYRKGKVLVSRLLQVLDKPQGEHLLGSICHNIVTIIKKDHQDEVLPLLIGPLSRVIEMTSTESALQSLKYIVYGNSEPPSPLSFVLANQFGISILCALLKKATAARIDTETNEESRNSWNELVSQVTKQFTDVPVKLLAKNLNGVTPLVTVLGVCASPHDMSDLHQHYRLALSTREELNH